MTFMDQVHHDHEVAAAKSVKQLQLWAATIGPLSPATQRLTQRAMTEIATEMGWAVEYDPVLGIHVVDVR